MEDLESMRCLIACGDRTVISKGKRDKIQERKKKYIHSSIVKEADLLCYILVWNIPLFIADIRVSVF